MGAVENRQALPLVAMLGAAAGVVALAALGLNGAESSGALYAAERLTAEVTAAVGLVLAMATVVLAARSNAADVVRSLCLALAVVPLSVPVVWAAAYEPVPAVADTTGCGSMTSPQVLSEAPVRSACSDALATQRALAVSFGLVALAVAGAAVTLSVRGSAPHERRPDLREPDAAQRA